MSLKAESAAELPMRWVPTMCRRLVARPREGAGIVRGRRRRKLIGIHGLKFCGGGRFCRGQSLLGVVGNVVADPVPRQAEAILGCLRKRDGIAVIGGLLDEKAEPELPRELVIELLHQCRPEQGFVVFVELADVLPIDEIDRCRIRISDREIPAFVADLYSKCPAVAAEFAVAA